MSIFVKILITFVFAFLCLVLSGVLMEFIGSPFAGLFLAFGLYGIYLGIWKTKKQLDVELPNKADNQNNSLQE